MELRLINYFIAVANEGNISNAAKVLHISQPALSKQMSELETELDTKLFIRTNRKIQLTDQGQYFLKHSREIVSLVDKTINNINDSTEIQGDIYIGGGETQTFKMVAKTMQNLLKKHPKVKFRLFSGNADDIYSKMSNGLLDFSILIEPFETKDYDYLKLPFIDQWGVLMSRDSPLATKKFLTPDDLKDKPLMMSNQTSVQNIFNTWFGQSTENLNIISTYNLITNPSKMVAQGLGYAFTFEGLITPSEENGLEFVPLKPDLLVNLDLVWNKNPHFSKAAKAFLEQFREDWQI
ncbi:LysR family transcriptional regulator [Companilactobacillus baiquanensis]|uniref:LysR family transcriptional regulator n=1 Tax=Companilactobacillus baiquanensis TaxID=2486005 RepID=A0ABW1UXP5_9LACO|nr:LysR family transcriptional regulator [Companilactobacillus baiquanensis]